MLAATLPLAISLPAFADLEICNRTSFVVETAIGIEDKGAAATRGWFRIDPGQCRSVLRGDPSAEKFYAHARTLPIYGQVRPLTASQAELCVGDGDFLIAGARRCTQAGNRMAPFAEMKPRRTENGQAVIVAEPADYTPEQARFAAIQRLLVLAGYGVEPIDGVSGPRSDAALASFLRDRNLPQDTSNTPGFMDLLMEAAREGSGPGLLWCNETKHTVMAALGIDDGSSQTSRGWWRIQPGACVRPDLPRKTARVFSCGGGRCKRRRYRTQRPPVALGWRHEFLRAQQQVRDFRPERLQQPSIDATRISAGRIAEPHGRHDPVQGALMTLKNPRDFARVETWVFDLDNTLYPPALDLWEQIDTRMRDFISRFLSIPKDEAFKIQKHYYKTYGTSLKGLMTEHNLQPDEFLEYVHDIDRSSLMKNPDLHDAIKRLQGRKLILTNGTRAHANAILDQIGLGDLFDDVHDIISANYLPKPHTEVYDRFLEAHGVHAERAAMFEDLARNLEAPHRLGMTTVLVVPKSTEQVIREKWEHEGRDEPYVDHVTDDLANFLTRLS